MAEILEWIYGAVWGVPAFIMIISVGVCICIKTNFCQITMFPNALRKFFNSLQKKSQDGETSGYRALCTALAATVGTGNIAGVAGAICLGGPGAVFWMWICGVLGMGIKYAEATLAVFHRQKNKDGEWCGGPMYMIRNGLGNQWMPLAYLYCLFGVTASFGIGNATQINALISSMSMALAGIGHTLNTVWKLGIGMILAIAVFSMLRGGAKMIGAAAQQLVPAASVVYICMCLWVIGVNITSVDDALCAIIRGAFNPKAVTGGVIGSAVSVIRIGVSRGIFTNEAGMGTASIAHAAAEVDKPAEQGFMGIMEVFLDTIVICTMTALALLTSGISIPYGIDPGAQLTGEAFYTVFGNLGSFLLFGTLSCFAFATILGWGLYGVRCAEFLFGHKAMVVFPVIQGFVVLVAVFCDTRMVWMICDILNGLMTIPNLIALIMLMPELVRLTNDYKIAKCKKRDAS